MLHSSVDDDVLKDASLRTVLRGNLSNVAPLLRMRPINPPDVAEGGLVVWFFCALACHLTEVVFVEPCS